MRTNVFKLLVILFIVTFSLDNRAAELKRDIPKAAWEPGFFESINQLGRKAGWKPLREAPLPSASHIRGSCSSCSSGRVVRTVLYWFALSS